MIQGSENLLGQNENGVTVNIPIQAISDFVHGQDELVTGNVVRIEFESSSNPLDTTTPQQPGFDDTYLIEYRDEDAGGTPILEIARFTVHNGRDGIDGSDGLPGAEGDSLRVVNYQPGAGAGQASTLDIEQVDSTGTVVSTQGITIQPGQPGTDGTDGQDGRPGRDGTDGEDGFILTAVNVTALNSPGAGDASNFRLNLTGTLNGVATGFNQDFTVPAGAPGTAGERISAVVDEGLGPNGGRVIDFVVDGAELNTPVEIPAGTAGTDGNDGDDGAPGASAYEVAVADGFVGDEAAWLASLRGADGTDGTNGLVTNATIVVNRGALTDGGTISGGEITLNLTDHQSTAPIESPDPFFQGERSRVATGAAINFNFQLLDRHGHFTYDITNINPTSGNGFTASTTGDQNLTISGTNVGSFTTTVTATATRTSDSQTSTVTPVITVVITEAPAEPTPYYIFVSENPISFTANQDLSTYTEVDTTLMDGDFITFRRPTGVTGTYYGAVAVPTSGADALTIETESSFDQGQSVPDENTGTPSGVARATDYQIFIFPLHLPTTRIQIN